MIKTLKKMTYGDKFNTDDYGIVRYICLDAERDPHFFVVYVEHTGEYLAIFDPFDTIYEIVE